MAGFASQSILRSKWGELVDTGSTNLPETSEVSKGLKNVVGWFKQASIEVREAGKRAVSQFHNSNSNLYLSSQTQYKIEDELDPLSRELCSDATAKNLITMTNYDNSFNENKCKTSNSKHERLVNDDNFITILHYNDVYNIDPNSCVEPIGGAAKFCTAIKAFNYLNPIVLFSGDVFSPSMLSTFTKGEQMIPVLNAVGTKCAVFGNHDFDHGLDVLTQWVEQTNFPWLMSNVVDNETGRPLGGGKITHIYKCSESMTIGLIGLVEKEWLDTLPTIDPTEVTYIDFIKAGNQLADELRNEGCQLIIALTHMRTPNDIELAKHCPKIDLILGGHDHVFETININGTNIIKSGTDFRQFSKITLLKERNKNGKIDLNVEQIDVTSSYQDDEDLKMELAKYSNMIESKMTDVLGNFTVELDGRFSKIRTSETNLGDWVCDVILAATGADVVLINSGTFRSDQIHPPGPFTMRDLVNIIPMRDPLVVLKVPGYILLEALENSVSSYPKLEGRFPQVSGLSFVFDATKNPGTRVDSRLVRIADEWLNTEQTYTVCIKSYMYGGCDGYTMFKACSTIMDDDACPELGLAIQNHFKAIEIRTGKVKHSKHRQSLVTLSRRHSMIQMLENIELDGPTPIRRTTFGNSPMQASKFNDNKLKSIKLLRRASLDDLEQVSCQLAPAIQHRIVMINSEEHLNQLLRKRETMENNIVINELDENTP